MSRLRDRVYVSVPSSSDEIEKSERLNPVGIIEEFSPSSSLPSTSSHPLLLHHHHHTHKMSSQYQSPQQSYHPTQPLSIQSQQPNYPPRQPASIQSPTNSTGSDFDTPSLPRYSSPAPPHHHHPHHQPQSQHRPQNAFAPQAPIGGPRPFISNSGPHPLSQPTYADSSVPTLTGSDRSAEKRFMAGPPSPGLGGPEKFINESHTHLSPTTGLSASHSNHSQASLSARSAVAYAPEYGMMTKIYRAWNGSAISDSGVDERHVKKKRLGYLDALKFFAALAVMNGTLFDAVLSENDYKVIQRGSPLYIFR